MPGFPWFLSRTPKTKDTSPIVCVCHGVSRNAILAAMDPNTRSITDLQKKMRIMKRCSGCEPEILEILEQGAEGAPSGEASNTPQPS
jgi:bacterioferritin-associated ferredoxin